MATHLYELLVPSFALCSRNSFRQGNILKHLKKSNTKIHGQQFPRHSSICFLKSNCVPVFTNTQRRIWKRTLSSSPLSCQHNGKEEESITSGPKKEEDIDIGGGTWQEVYSGLLTTQLKLVKMFSIGTSVIGLSMQPILYEKLGTGNVAVAVTVASFLGFFTFVTPALIHWVAKKYVTKLEYDPRNDVYVATVLSFFLREKKIPFKVDDVIRPEIPGMFTSFLVKNKPLFVDPSMFDDVDHYSRIMGYDKPIDFSYDRHHKRK